jgi:hypothetical protein
MKQAVYHFNVVTQGKGLNIPMATLCDIPSIVWQRSVASKPLVK